MEWRLLTRAEVTDVFGQEVTCAVLRGADLCASQFGLQVPNEPRLCPLPRVQDEKVLHAICPMGNLLRAVRTQGRTLGRGAEVAVLEEKNSKYAVRYQDAAGAVKFWVEKAWVGVSYPVVVRWERSMLSIRYRIAVFNNTECFDYPFSVYGWT